MQTVPVNGATAPATAAPVDVQATDTTPAPPTDTTPANEMPTADKPPKRVRKAAPKSPTSIALPADVEARIAALETAAREAEAAAVTAREAATTARVAAVNAALKATADKARADKIAKLEAELAKLREGK